MTLSQAFVHKSGAGAAVANVELEFAGLNPETVWDVNDQSLKCEFYRTLLIYIGRDNVGVSQVSEGGYSISYDKDDKGKYQKALAIESGCKDLIEQYSDNVVKNMSHLW